MIINLLAFTSLKAEVLNFDDLTIDVSMGTCPVPSGYKGFTWSTNDNGWCAEGIDHYRTAYTNELSFPSNPNAIFNGDIIDRFGSSPMTIYRSRPFNFHGAFFSSWTAYNNQYWYGATQLTIEGKRNGIIIGTSTIDLSPGEMSFNSINMLGVNTLTFIATPGADGQYWLMDNFTYTDATPTPQVEVANKIYGVCTGIRRVKNDFPLPPAEFRGDWGAALVAEKLRRFSKNDKNIKTFIGDFDAGGVKKSDIKNYLTGLSVNPDDLLIIYITGHGVVGTLSGAYAIEIGPEQSTLGSEGLLSASDLYDCLKNKSCTKWIIVDSCHSGRFNSGIAGLTKYGLLTATTQGYEVSGWAPTWFIQYGWFTVGLLNAFNNFITKGEVSFEELYCYMKDVWPSTQEFQNALGTTMYELDFGDPAVFTADKYDPGATKNGDLNGIKLSGNTIPAINMLLLD